MTFARARALAVVGVLALVAVVVVVTALVRDRQSAAGTLSRCGGGDIRISTKLPPQSAINLHVYNGTAVPNLAGRVAEELRGQGFTVDKVAENPSSFDHVARLSYGPRAVGA